MVVLDILKEIEPICVSKKLGLYIKYLGDRTTYDYIINLIEDEFYKNNFPQNIERLNSKQLISMILKVYLKFLKCYK